MKIGCENKREPVLESKPRSLGGRSAVSTAKSAFPVSGIRKSKTSRWRAAALILVNLLMVAHVIQWWIVGKTVSPIEPSETMHTLQQGAINAGFIFFPWRFWRP